MILKSKKVEQCVEILCLSGCRQVCADIEALKTGSIFPEVESLTDGERQQVLAELQSIMAAYEDGCSQ